MEKMFKKDKSKYIALSVSLGVHVILFAALAIIQFSRPSANAQTYTVSTASISRALQAPLLVPKPKVISSKLSNASNITANNIQLDILPVFDIPTPTLPRVTQVGKLDLLPDIGVNSENFTDFFGTASIDRKIVYVVDVSGSMLGLVSQVRTQLKTSIASLKPDCYFYVIFFGGDKLFESGQGKLVRATPAAKRRVNTFIDSIKPGGNTNAATALERAMRIKDSSGRPSGQFFFLTDGFDMEDGQSQSFISTVENIRKTLAPDARINTIGFWMDDQDKLVLSQIAAKSRGQFVNIE